jgi:hypothetical protein
MVNWQIILKQPLSHQQMIKEMNWGTKLILGMVSFMVFIVVMGIIMISDQKDALVDNDYYERGINYNKVYNQKEQTKTDQAQPAIVLNEAMVLLTFTKPATGRVQLMRTADKALDQTIAFKSNINNQVIIPSERLKRGSWRVIITWVSNGKSYLYEQEITK